MKITSATIGKKLLTSIGNFSNVEVSHSMTIEFTEGEEPDWDAIYDTVNWNLQKESDGTDPSWIKKAEFKGFYRLTMKFPKRKVLKK